MLPYAKIGGVPVNGGSHFEGSEVPVLPGSQSAKNLPTNYRDTTQK
jgi:hypothetical protein